MMASPTSEVVKWRKSISEAVSGNLRPCHCPALPETLVKPIIALYSQNQAPANLRHANSANYMGCSWLVEMHWLVETDSGLPLVMPIGLSAIVTIKLEFVVTVERRGLVRWHPCGPNAQITAWEVNLPDQRFGGTKMCCRATSMQSHPRETPQSHSMTFGSPGARFLLR